MKYSITKKWTLFSQEQKVVIPRYSAGGHQRMD